MSTPTPPDLPAERRAAKKIKPLVWILGGTALLLACATLTVSLLAVHAVSNAGFAFRFDPAKKALVLIGADGREVKTPAPTDGDHALGAAEQRVLATWLNQNPDYRAAVDADCACDEALRLNQGAHPYTALGDFNHDGKKDFAAAVINKKTGKFALLIFNGPIGGAVPALFLKDLDLRRQGLFFNPSFDAKPNLYYGYYNSDDMWRVTWSGDKYRLEYASPVAEPDAAAATLVNSDPRTFVVENRRINPKLRGCGESPQEFTGCVYVEFTYAELTGGPAEARKRINAAILAFVTACWPGPEGDLCHDLHIEQFTPESLAGYIVHAVGRFQKENPAAPSSMLSRSVTVLHSAAPVLSLRFVESSYIGGTHPMSATSFLNFDPATGEPIKLSSILKDGAMARLTEIAEVHFRQARKLTATAKLVDEGFGGAGFGWPDGRFALNDNYGFSEKALLFFFNQYEIAPYAMGSTLVEIPYAEIRDLIRPEFSL